MYKSDALIAHFFIVAKMHIKKAPLREQWSLDGSFAVLLDDLVPWQDVVEVLFSVKQISPFRGADVFLDQLCGQSELSPVLDRAEPSKRYLYSLLSIPVHIIIQDLYELVNGDILPGTTIEHLVLQPAEEALAYRIIRRAAFL